jgi:hypothetical protein
MKHGLINGNAAKGKRGLGTGEVERVTLSAGYCGVVCRELRCDGGLFAAKGWVAEKTWRGVPVENLGVVDTFYVAADGDVRTPRDGFRSKGLVGGRGLGHSYRRPLMSVCRGFAGVCRTGGGRKLEQFVERCNAI